jgi:pyruvate dehydrogenase E2 component (dihydrolipoamide acetyltransferase)
MTVSPAALHRLGGEGPPVLLVHGFGADRYGWAANAHALMGSRTVWAADLPGHGSAGNDVGDGSPATLAAALADSVADLADALPVIGHSMGGAVALHLARLLPDRVRTLVLIAPATVGPPGAPGFIDRFPAMASAEEAAEVLALLTDRPAVVAPMIPHVLTSLDVPGRRAALSAIAKSLVAAAPSPRPEDARVTLIWGEADRVLPCPDGPLLGEEPHVVPGTGHLPHVEKAGAVNRLIRAALEVE